LNDTSPAAEKRYFELLSERSAVERLAMALRLSSMVRELAEAAIRAERPDAPERTVRKCLADRLYGPGVASRLFPNEG
jgi:hypothetical protein